MPKFTIELPAGFADLIPSLEKYAADIQAATPETEDGGAVDMMKYERAMESSAAALEQESTRRLVQRLDIDAEKVIIQGKSHSRVGRYQATYKTKAGPVTVTRSLYREDGVRNAKTVDPVSLRAGVVGNGWLPETAKAMAFLIQQGTSREAENTAHAVGRLPYSRSSFERVGHKVGAAYQVLQGSIEAVLMEKYQVPESARSASLGLDRVSVPMEEPLPRPVGRPREGAPRRPIERNFRMAYVGTVTLHDSDGDALHTFRYGRMPQGDVDAMCARMAEDVAVLLRQRPELSVAILTDGAPEMRNRLAAKVNQETLHTPVVELVDFWHVMEKLGKAASVTHPDSGAQQLQRWKMTLLNKTNAAAGILAELQQSGHEHTRVGDTQPVHDAITYLTNGGDRMGYAAARAQALPIGSGNTEATCKCLFDTRLKRCGSRWKNKTGEEVVQLRAAALNERWEASVNPALELLHSSVLRAG